MGTDSDVLHADRGRVAESPLEIPLRGWKDILWRVWAGLEEERVLLIAAGATFYLLIALFPAITAFVSIYGLFFDPSTAMEHVAALGALLPESGVEIIRERLQHLTSQGRGVLSLGLVAGFLFAFWGANNGVKAIFDAMNVAYDEKEKRSFLKLNLLALLFTLGAIATATTLIAVIGIAPVVLKLLNLGSLMVFLLGAVRWLTLIVLITAGISLLYRYGPSRKCAQWRWITWGSALAAGVWVATSAGFSFYLRNFASFEALYGSLGAMIGFLVWMWISVAIVIVGAKINAEMEHQTTRDTTTGTPQNKGQRGAVVADNTGAPS